MLAGYLMFATTSGILMALFLDNVGGAWDNAKKYVELGHHGGKGSPAHKVRHLLVVRALFLLWLLDVAPLILTFLVVFVFVFVLVPAHSPARFFCTFFPQAAVTGDTVGDPFKDTAGPALHVVIKLLSTTILVLAPLFVSSSQENAADGNLGLGSGIAANTLTNRG